MVSSEAGKSSGPREPGIAGEGGSHVSLMSMEVRCRLCRQVLAGLDGDGLRLDTDEGSVVVAGRFAATLTCPHCGASCAVTTPRARRLPPRQSPVRVTQFPKL